MKQLRLVAAAVAIGAALWTPANRAAAQETHPPDDHRSPIGLFPSDPELSRFVLAYPRRQDGRAAFDRLFALNLVAFQQAGRQRGDPHYLAMLYAFYVHVARRWPDLLDAAVARAVAERDNAGGLPRLIVVHDIVYYSGLTQKRPLLARLRAAAKDEGPRLAAQVEGKPTFPYPTMHPAQPQDLDILWAAFFGSADPKYLERISLCLAHWKPWPELKARLGEIKAAFNGGDPAARAEFSRIACGITAYRFLRNHVAVYPEIIGLWLAMASASGPVAPVQRAILEEVKQSGRK